MFLTLKERVDSLCDYTYTFTLKNSRLHPDSVIPYQEDTNYTFKDLVDELRSGGEVRIVASAGKRLANSMGTDLRQFGGSGNIEKAGRIYIDGDVASEMGMGMVAGIIYVKGNIEEPLGNIVEVVSDQEGYRKFRSITEILCNGVGKDKLIKNNYNEQKKHLTLNDCKLRGTIGARCYCDALVSVEGGTYNGTGLLMRKGVVHVMGDAGMNSGAHLDGGIVVVDGMAGEFAGAYMKKGTLILNDTKGFAGANLKDGVIYAHRKIRTAPPVEELSMSQEDAKVMIKHLGIRHVEAMSYHKYGIARERLVKMRDGSVVVRKVGE
ncbi:MAG: formylmethanofuran dehydrogenase [Candidatus Methanoperedens sp.]|nr:formylmethanofuran dehydrogenase [Candidatus Methanoperedens sp.]